MLSYVDTLATDRERLPSRPWQFADWPLRLTEEEAHELAEQVNALLVRYRREPGDPEPREGTVRAVFQFQLLPDPAPQPAEPGTSGTIPAAA
jgi:hypothetical protein